MFAFLTIFVVIPANKLHLRWSIHLKATRHYLLQIIHGGWQYGKIHLWYELHGDYYLPCLVIPEEVHTIGIWGRKHQQYLREHRPIIYSDLVLSGKLYSYLADIDTQARNMLDLLVTQIAEKEGINEHLKAQNQLAWVRAMNNIRNRAEEIVLKELIYGEDEV